MSSRQYCFVKRLEAFARITACKVVLGVGDIAQVFLASKLSEIELRVIRQKELIARCIDKVFGYFKPLSVAIIVWVFKRKYMLIFRRADFVREDLVIDIILKRRREEA